MNIVRGAPADPADCTALVPPVAPSRPSRARLLRALPTLWRLGPGNLLRVALYRLAVRNPASTLRRLRGEPARGPFFTSRAAPHVASPAAAGLPPLFGWAPVPAHEVPDFLTDPITGRRAPAPDRPWYAIGDFDPRLGDIKPLWELSRLSFAPALAQQALAGDASALPRLEAWIARWCEQNPPYRGHNWKCGQEAAIRVLHLAITQLMLGEPAEAKPGLLDLVALHLRRIAPTTAYARAQDNNHGTSEAAALFVGGSWLRLAGRPEGARHERRGRAMLEERVGSLVMADGCFSQYSVVYQRLLIDTLVMAETWRRRAKCQPFSPPLVERALAATRWLRRMVDPETGDAPNSGANDGACLLPSAAPFRDFRPSVARAAALFGGVAAFSAASADWDNFAAGMGLPATPLRPASWERDDAGAEGGFAVLARGPLRAVLRVPRFRFRPSQCDPLHLDLWDGGRNLLPDAGTWSYNPDRDVSAHLSGVRGHNTVELDGREPMPRLSRFLFGDWLTPRDVAFEPQAGRMAAGYRDRHGGGHHRAVSLSPDLCCVTDTLTGCRRAILRWRLDGPDWRLTDTGVTDGIWHLTIKASGRAPAFRLTHGLRSLLYLQCQPGTVLEVHLDGPGRVITRIGRTC